MNIQTEAVGTSFPSEPHIKSNLLLVAREAVRNALTHANANHVLIRLAAAKQEFQMEIRDDGCGFDVRTTAKEEDHYGILGMRERIEQLGGRLSLSSGRGKGTRVLVTVPVNGARAREARQKS